MKTVDRYEDMSPGGRLRLIQQDDGDIIVIIVPDPDEPRHYAPDMEFCTTSGGGQSQHTREALRHLMIAMEKDNEERPQERK